MTDRLRMELREDRSQAENYILDKNADLKSEIALLRDKIVDLRAGLKAKDSEIEKI